MKICRFRRKGDAVVRAGLAANETELFDLTPAGITRLAQLLDSPNPLEQLKQLSSAALPRISIAEALFCAPVESQEVWAAGVTYLRSKAARMEESDFSATAYDRVYAAERPEIFFKSLGEKVSAHAEPVGIRRDARWNVPEPELALVLNSRGEIAGLTIGNDMSSRDIEGENLLYLPQAKVYDRSCALGPWIILGASEAVAREWQIRIAIQRNGKSVFTGETSVGKIKRSFAELAGFLFRCQRFPHGAVLLTGTGIVPSDSFTLSPGTSSKSRSAASAFSEILSSGCEVALQRRGIAAVHMIGERNQLALALQLKCRVMRQENPSPLPHFPPAPGCTCYRQARRRVSIAARPGPADAICIACAIAQFPPVATASANPPAAARRRCSSKEHQSKSGQIARRDSGRSRALDTRDAEPPAVFLQQFQPVRLDVLGGDPSAIAHLLRDKGRFAAGRGAKVEDRFARLRRPIARTASSVLGSCT